MIGIATFRQVARGAVVSVVVALILAFLPGFAGGHGDAHGYEYDGGRSYRPLRLTRDAKTPLNWADGSKSVPRVIGWTHYDSTSNLARAAASSLGGC